MAVVLYAPPKNKIQKPRRWREQKGWKECGTTGKEKQREKRDERDTSEGLIRAREGKQRRGTELAGGEREGAKQRKKKRDVDWRVKNKNVLQPPNYLNLHRIMNTAIKTNKKKQILLTLLTPRSMLTLCKETVNTDERRLARDYRPKKREKKKRKKKKRGKKREEKTREKGQTKRGENRGDIGVCTGSAW